MHRKTAGRDIEVVALTRHEWRICDGTIDERDARRVLGYIEELSNCYEVLALCPAPRVQGEYRSWDDALAALLATAASGRSGGSGAAAATPGARQVN